LFLPSSVYSATGGRAVRIKKKEEEAVRHEQTKDGERTNEVYFGLL
jgi:hypothetical protein